MKRLMACTVLVAMSVYLSVPGTATAGESEVPAADRVFAMMAAEGGLTEVQLAKQAAERATNPEVKQFAQLLVQDHTKANQELMNIAEKKDISVPEELGDTHEEVVELFSDLEGQQYDRQFLLYQVMHHEKDTAAFNVQAKQGQDPDLKAFAAKQLPVLQEHLQKARDLAAQHATATGGGAKEQRSTR